MIIAIIKGRTKADKINNIATFTILRSKKQGLSRSLKGEYILIINETKKQQRI